MKITFTGVMTVLGAAVVLGYYHANEAEKKAIETITTFGDQHQQDLTLPLEGSDMSYVLNNFDTHWSMIDEIDQEIAVLETDLVDSTAFSRMAVGISLRFQRALSQIRLRALMTEMERQLRRI